MPRHPHPGGGPLLGAFIGTLLFAFLLGLVIERLVLRQLIGEPIISVIMVTIDMANVGKWAENHQLVYTTFTDLSQKREVYELICQEVKTANDTLPKVAKVNRFVLLYKELDADDELTRTRKVRRKFVKALGTVPWAGKRRPRRARG